MGIFSALPLGVHEANAHLVGWIAMHIVHYRRRVVEENIANSFPDAPAQLRRRYVKDFYLHFGQLVCETIWFSHTTPRRMASSKIVSVVNPEETSRLHSAAPGTILLAGHYANWEILFGFEHFDLPPGRESSYALNRSNAAMVYKKLSSPLWDDIFRECRLRLLGTDFGNYIESANILRHVVEHRSDGLFYFFDTDQRPYAGAKAVMNVEFMGQKAQTMYAGAGVAHKYGLAVAYFSMTRKPSGRGYLCEVKTICDDASKMEVQDIMNEFYRLLEEDIRKDPGAYLWSHRRWKQVNKRTI
ncbi:MAG: lysophospholipid acyltransferase family protein [Candidatus Cryptobacteroides sp.]